MKKWVKPPIEAERVRALAAHHNMDLLTASILTRREMTDPETIAFFLENDERFLHNPLLFPDMERAVERVLAAAEEGEKVLVCGDKDADGITATVLMVESLRSVGIDPEWRVPLEDEDYGLNPEVLKEKASEDFSLVICVDCGITDFGEIDLAVDLGMDVLIFDHHMPREGRLPKAYAVVNPKLPGDYPFDGLCAVAVSSKFQWALSLAGTDLWGEEFCLILGRTEPSETGEETVIEALRMRNLLEVAYLEVRSSEAENGRDKLLRFIEGQPLFTYGKNQQIALISGFFGGAEVHVLDTAEEIAASFPALRNRSPAQLADSSRLARYFPGRSGALGALSSLIVTYHHRRLSSAFDGWRRGLDLVALGTLADLMPLVDENRILVRMGSNRLNGSDALKERRRSLRELLLRQRLHEGRVGTVEMAWQLCPLINASGRMGRADVGVKLFLSTDTRETEALADELVSLNKKRRNLGEQLWDKIRPIAYRSLDDLGGRMCIIADDETPRGITGILATRLQKNLGATAVVLSRRGEVSSGSVRSSGSPSALSWLEAMASLFDDFGGHPQAGGFRIASKNIDRLIDESRRWIDNEKPRTDDPDPISIDAELTHDEFGKLGNRGLDALLESLEPYGEGFRPLTFLTRSVRIHSAELVGKPKNNHLKLLVSLGSERWPALWWDGASRYGKEIRIDSNVDLVYRVDRDRWRGVEARRLTILEASPCSA